MNRFDVAIIGGGPAGSSCAAVLAAAGIRTVLIEKAKFPRAKLCGDCLNPKVWDLLGILGVSETLRSKNLFPLSTVTFLSKSGHQFSINVPQTSQGPFVSFSRSEFDAILLNNARTKGAFVQEGQSVRTFDWSGVWSLQRAEGTILADYLVGADGRNSMVGRVLGARQKPGKSAARERVAVQWNCAYQERLNRSVLMGLFDGGYFGIVNLDEHCANIALVTTPRQAASAVKDFARFFDETIATNRNAAALLQSAEPRGTIRTVTPVNPVRRQLFHPRALLIGDARCTVEPFTGEGVFFALQDGIKAAMSLIARIHRTEPSLLPERKRFWVNNIFSPVLRRSGTANTAIELGYALPSGVGAYLASRIFSV